MARSKKGAASKGYPALVRPSVKGAAKRGPIVVHMSEEGRLTLPASARRRLGIDGEVDLCLDFESRGFVLTPAVILTQEDAWAYTSEHRRLLERAHADSREGRVRRLSEGQLDRVAARR